MTETQTTKGQELTATLRRYFRINGRSRRYRNGTDLHEQMIEAIGLATQYPGYYAGDTHRVFAGAWSIYCSYTKHVGGYRISGALRYRITQMTPWQFAGLLGQMVDAGVNTTGDGERFFAELGRGV